MARPGGNPDLLKHQFDTDRKEPLKYNFQVRLPKSMWEALQGIEDNKEFVRQAIATALLHLESD